MRDSTFTPPHLLDAKRWEGLRIGLLGGSFNPPHQGHIHISLLSLKTFSLDFIWWLVTPHNPLKEQSSLWPYEKRMALCHTLVQHPRLIVTDLERQLGVNRTYDTIRGLKAAFPRTDFLLLAGMDNARNFHRWYRWKDILKEAPIAFIARPPATALSQACPARQLATQRHITLQNSNGLDLAPDTIHWLLQSPLHDLSSTEIRELNHNARLDAA